MTIAHSWRRGGCMTALAALLLAGGLPASADNHGGPNAPTAAGVAQPAPALLDRQGLVDLQWQLALHGYDPGPAGGVARSGARRGGKGCVSPGRSRWSADPYKKQNKKKE